MNVVLCECRKSYPASKELERVAHAGEVYSVGTRCPYCRKFTHAFFENETIVSLRGNLEELGNRKHKSRRDRRRYTAALDQFARAFDALQEQYR